MRVIPGRPERFQKWLEEQFEQQLRDERSAYEELCRLLLPQPLITNEEL